jgi:oligoendopeptidase F
VLQRDWFLAQARNFETTLDAALFDNAIPRAVVETLVASTARRHGAAAALRAAAPEAARPEGVPPVRRLRAAGPQRQEVPLRAGARDALASVAPLGEEYGSATAASCRAAASTSTKARASAGAYNAGVYGVGPYLLLNHNDTMDAMFTLAHEAGHAMHTVLSYEHQPFVTSDYTIFVAEVASTTNERFLLEHLLQTTTDAKERFLLLQHAADQIMGTFYTQVMFADFELQAHRLVEQGQPVTAEVLNKRSTCSC